MGNPSFVDRYRWWLFLGAFAINLPFSAIKVAVPELTAVYSVVNVLSVIPLVAGIAGFFYHGHRRRREKAEAETRAEQSD